MMNVTQESQYLNLLSETISTGTQQQNRTGIRTIFIPGAMMKFDLRVGFPAFTTKKLAFRAVVGELLGFLRGYDNAADFRSLGCNIWNQNANENQDWLNNPHRKGADDLGRIYGVQWRKWNDYSIAPSHYSEWVPEHIEVKPLDQVDAVLQKLYNNPTDRRMIINAWRPDEFQEMALPPCHVLYQFIANTEKKELHLCMYQRSCDEFLGVPFNVASASLFLTIMANLTGYTPATFTHFMADAHVYENHLDAVNEQINREPYPLPQLKYTGPKFNGTDKFDATIFDMIQPDHFELVNYQHHPAIKAPMAV